eukprot:c6170_g1_i1.p1 GENE.c6170_g1_i1~~c6170_g1_i1.p1  ORF type:complete len:178 (+),score=38.15 c6170_g1_i1:316-849(+)
MDIMNVSYWPLQEELPTKLKQCTSLDWNPSRLDAPMVVVGGEKSDSDSVYIKIFEYNDSTKKWALLLNLGDADGPTDVVRDVAWAPNLGRTYHLIAAASEDRNVYLWRLRLGGDHAKPSADLLCKFSDHKAKVWRVHWNVTATILASSGDDGSVITWRCGPNNVWEKDSEMRKPDQI